MNSKRRVGIASGVLLAILASLALFLHNSKLPGFESNTQDDSYRNLTEGYDERSKSKRVRNAPRALDPRVANSLKTIYYTDDILTNKQVEAYLDNVGRNASTITIAYWLTSDVSYIRELRDYVDSPVALQLVSQFDSDIVVASNAAKRLMEIDAENPMGFYLTARSEALSGNAAAALDLLGETAKLRGPLTNATSGSYQGALSALESMGMDPTEANLYLWNHDDIFTTSHFPLTQMAAALLQPEQVSSGVDLASRASALLQVCLRTADAGDNSAGAARQLMQNEVRILRDLPDDYEYGDGQTVGQRKAELKQLYKEDFKKSDQLNDAMRAANEGTMNQYVQTVEDRGWRAAREWLLSQKTK